MSGCDEYDALSILSSDEFQECALTTAFAITTGGFVQLTPSLYQWRGSEDAVNSYVLLHADGVCVIDPAADLTRAALREITPGVVTRLLITHVQAEHIDGCRNFLDATVHVPAGDEYLCQGRDAYQSLMTKWPPPWEWETRGNFQGHIAGVPNERPASGILRLGKSLVGGETFAGFRILSTPGHGKHAVTLLADVDGRSVAFCGDLIHDGARMWNWFDCEWDYGLQAGHRELIRSLDRLRWAKTELLCPAHGDVILVPNNEIDLLRDRLGEILDPPPAADWDDRPYRVQERPSRAPNFRQLLPHLHQYAVDSGSLNVLLSNEGAALLIDDGLCYWKPLPERAEHHRKVIAEMKEALGVSRIEVIIPTHYHGDHLENIPEAVASDGCEVVSLDTVAGPVEHPVQFNLPSTLPWYGTSFNDVRVDRRLRNGERFRWREYEIELFLLGGQTYYHSGISVTVDDERVLFAGDSLGSLTPTCEPVLCYNDNEPEHRGWAFAIDRMIEHQPDLIVCGHAYSAQNPMPLLRAKRKAWDVQLARFRAINARSTLHEFFHPPTIGRKRASGAT